MVSFSAAVDPPGTPCGNRQGAFYGVHGSSGSTGLLVARAWG
ncbi:hypothetical protein [Nonomuraea montanisoli]|nr:hypothetical protein [Nonomuraea montanisoli]